MSRSIPIAETHSLREGIWTGNERHSGFYREGSVDMIVMSVRELDPVIASHLPQSDAAHALVSRAPCPVLTIR
jgi:hypothetical protein